MKNRETCDEAIRTQIETALEQDTQRIGDVYRWNEKHRGDVKKIQEEMGIDGPGGVYSYFHYIDALFEDFDTESPSKALQVHRQLASFKQRHASNLNPKTNEYIDKSMNKYFSIYQNEEKQQIETRRSADTFNEIASKKCIYVYSFPHYVKYPHVASKDGITDDRYMLKLGRTRNSAEKRVAQQTTAMPWGV